MLHVDLLQLHFENVSVKLKQSASCVSIFMVPFCVHLLHNNFT